MGAPIGRNSGPVGSSLYVIGVMSVANVKVMDGAGLSTRGGMSVRHGSKDIACNNPDIEACYAPSSSASMNTTSSLCIAVVILGIER